MRIVAAKSILKANDQLAAENRARFAREGLFAVNLVGSPGCGKTTLLEGLVHQFGDRVATAVIEGDVAGQIDAERMEKIGVPVVQINTDGMCHLDANMISAARDGLGVSARPCCSSRTSAIWSVPPVSIWENASESWR